MTLLLLAFVAAPASRLDVRWDSDLVDEAAEGGYDVAVRQEGEHALKNAERWLGLTYEHRLVVVVHGAPTYERLFGALAGANWSAHYQRGEIHVNGGVPIDAEFGGLLQHEMVHAVLDRGAGRLPLWASEGVAEFVRGIATGQADLDDGYKLMLRDALARSELKPLASLRAPLSANEYLYCRAATIFFKIRYGEALLSALAVDTVNGGDFTRLFEERTKTTAASFEAQLTQWLRRD